MREEFYNNNNISAWHDCPGSHQQPRTVARRSTVNLARVKFGYVSLRYLATAIARVLPLFNLCGFPKPLSPSTGWGRPTYRFPGVASHTVQLFTRDRLTRVRGAGDVVWHQSSSCRASFNSARVLKSHTSEPRRNFKLLFTSA